ncbi:peptide chain release factor N(5)-glutamine methyltransferase [Gemella sanguinis]|jgi:protein-(glutamine-N5) methyltransferase, release factor-specific|uniref:peptide chain release factor N(5)-glutamine methyltransferase n=1 Tax=Gemella sanguinis TaxID=84135 RepID=UPI0004E18D78|nr:peptide chain release factor N(5)-glutamine methyltransferase [Gemella sanguinis]NKZ26251.1 peptide chain release factor N(5)-glutamine methyltransferase [Gemella sanguinis]
MNRRQAILKACLLLRRQDKEESLAKFLLMYMLDETAEQFSNKLSEELSVEQENRYFDLINKNINEDTPLSHLVGFDYFYDRKFKVTKDVLSPRIETEELIYKVLEYIKKSKKDSFRILDLCTGSGIIAITLKKEIVEKYTEIVASDISEKALSIAIENANNNNANITFIKSDLFDNISGKFDLIISNPPYISYKDKITIKDSVLNYDPHLALFAEEDGIYFYRKIIENANQYLENDGTIFLEIGYDQKEKILELGKSNNFITTVYKDINGKDRIAYLEYNK